MDVARERLARQRLVGERYARVEDVVAGLLAVQAQDFAGAKWAVAQRADGGDDATVQQAFQAGRIVRTHVLRPTWHFVAPADLRWLQQLTAPRVKAASAYQFGKDGLDAKSVRRVNACLEKALAGGRQLTREELGSEMTRVGVAGASGTRLAHFMMHAELDGVICSGAMRGKQQTYGLVEERVAGVKKRMAGRDELLAEMGRRYVEGHGPAQAQDLAWWSGLTVADAKRAFAAAGSAVVREVVGERVYWSPAAGRKVVRVRRRRGGDGPVVHLLPNYDELVIGFKDRSAMIDARVVARKDVLSAHFVVVDGRIAGGWRRTLGKGVVEIEVRLLREITAAERKGVEAAAGRYARSLGDGVTARVAVEVVR